MVLEKLPPHDIAAEEAVVATCLVDGEAVFKIAPILRPQDFFREKNGWIFEAVLALWDRNEAINQITVAHELARRDRLEAIGGPGYLAQIVADLPTVVGVEYYAQIVARDAVYRRLIQFAGNVAQRAYEGGSDLESVLGWAETQLMALRSGEALRDFVHIRTLLEKYLEDSGMEGEEDQSGPQVIRTGFIDLDTLLGGLKRSDLVILAARPSMGKCLAGNTTIVLSDGSISSIEQICRRRDAEVLTLDADWRLRIARPTDFIDNGIRPVVRVTTRLGRRIDCTPTHPFLTLDGWKPLDQLRTGEHVAVPRRMPVFGTDDLPEHQAKLLGYLLGDGGLTGSTPKFTNANPVVLEDFRRASAAFGGLAVRVESAGRGNGRNGLTLWLESLGLWGKGSREKFVPDVVFLAPKHAVATFLNRLFATAGWAAVLAGGQALLGYATVSEQLARQVQHLLLRFGVIASLRAQTLQYNGERCRAWQLDITDAESVRVFVNEIGIVGKEDAIASVRQALTGRRYQTNSDLISIQIWDRIERAKGTRSRAEVARGLGLQGAGVNLHVGTRALSRQRLGRFASVLDDPCLHGLAESDVYWDRIDSVEYLGEQRVYDLTVAETHNFVADDVIVHNSALAMGFARNAAMGQRAKVAVFSLEMSADQLAQRLLASEAGVDSTRLRLGEHTEAEERRIMTAMGHLASCDIFIDDTPVLTVGEMRGKALRLQREHGLDLVLVDYLQLMQGSAGRNDNRVQEISLISRTLKTIARELNVPVVALSQLSRAVESRTPHIPMLSDLRESGSIEQDADVVMFIYREDYYTRKEDFENANPERPSRAFPAGIAQVIVAKHRNGPTGTVDLRFVHKTAKFEDLMARDDEPL